SGAGRPRFTNRLALETSPYLLQHAHNPVNWFPWGDEAFAEAARLSRPVFLSIGYSTCHWCHVMEEESFEDEEIATFLNMHYVSIKVDREERPDIDAVYMSAVQQLTGSGGWPMSVWLNAAREPFFGGTYFPPRDGARGVRHGFLSLLADLSQTFQRDPERVGKAAAALVEAVRRAMQGGAGAPAGSGTVAGALPGREVIDGTVEFFKRSFDAVHGGVRRAPKFPSNVPVRLLLRHHHRTGDAEALNIATVTLEKMAAGGLYDQLAGGFHRYSTDARWLVPHFEKMLYDNALLVVAYAEAFQATGRGDFARDDRRQRRILLRHRRRFGRGGGAVLCVDGGGDPPAFGGGGHHAPVSRTLRCPPRWQLGREHHLECPPPRRGSLGGSGRCARQVARGARAARAARARRQDPHLLERLDDLRAGGGGTTAGRAALPGRRRTRRHLRAGAFAGT
ncbi:MAG: DUF255 domain-containing protein, partial [Myxococcales bacterium]